jgi:hypothetical protein
MTDDRIPLRELGERLVLYEPYRKSKSRGRIELLGLLQREELIARLDYPSNERPQINVPAAHWRNVKMNEFRKALDGNNKNKGDYLVSPIEFTKEYLESFSKAHRLPEHIDVLSAALRAGMTKAEVYVLAKDLEKFSEGLDTTQHSTTPQKSSKGLSENKNWSAIMVEVAVELLNASRDSLPDPNVIAANARKQVTAREKTELPQTDTIRKKVDEIIRRVWES